MTTLRSGESVGSVVIDRFLGLVVLLAIGGVALLLNKSAVDPRLTWAVPMLFTAGVAAFGLLRSRALMRRFSWCIPGALDERTLVQ